MRARGCGAVLNFVFPTSLRGNRIQTQFVESALQLKTCQPWVRSSAARYPPLEVPEEHVFQNPNQQRDHSGTRLAGKQGESSMQLSSCLRTLADTCVGAATKQAVCALVFELGGVRGVARKTRE